LRQITGEAQDFAKEAFETIGEIWDENGSYLKGHESELQDFANENGIAYEDLTDWMQAYGS
jgi:hypothetical protein